MASIQTTLSVDESLSIAIPSHLDLFDKSGATVRCCGVLVGPAALFHPVRSSMVFSGSGPRTKTLMLPNDLVEDRQESRVAFRFLSELLFAIRSRTTATSSSSLATVYHSPSAAFAKAGYSSVGVSHQTTCSNMLGS